MVFGKIRTIVDPVVKVAGQILEVVDSFKFLGVHIERDGGHKKHIEVRRSAFFAGLSEIVKLGANEKDLPISILP